MFKEVATQSIIVLLGLASQLVKKKPFLSVNELRNSEKLDDVNPGIDFENDFNILAFSKGRICGVPPPVQTPP